MKIVFFGTPNFAKIILGSLIKNDNFNIAAVVANPDKPVGRKKILTAPPAKQLAVKNNIEVLQPTKLKDDVFIRQIKKIGADLFVVASYGKIIPKEILDIPKYGCINVHGSLLPEYRGASPIQYALLDSKAETGITVMLMDEGMDTGHILAKKPIKIADSDNFFTLSEKMAYLGAETLNEILPKWVEGKIKPTKQDDCKATYTKLFKEEDFKIDWNQSAEKIHNSVRGLYPNAYAQLRITNYELRIKIIKSQKLKIESQKEFQNSKLKLSPGMLIKYNKILLVVCGDGNFLELVKIQPSGKNIMLGRDFLNGHKEIPNILTD